MSLKHKAEDQQGPVTGHDRIFPRGDVSENRVGQHLSQRHPPLLGHGRQPGSDGHLGVPDRRGAVPPNSERCSRPSSIADTMSRRSRW